MTGEAKVTRAKETSASGTSAEETMVERVARAIMVDSGCGFTITGEHVFCDDPRVRDPQCCTCKTSARAAIGAMREPTEAMEDAARKANKYDTLGPKGIYWAMIDAALSEGGER